ncbi:MAG: protein phosphatase 2C domain-containing protein [Bacteroides sp.]|nr:protein phosphatase 2C domain-containing protein [Muribaculum sp.]MCM1333347.1 protein phosphatase 2C domain-containing protein [Bacteroides sp.]
MPITFSKSVRGASHVDSGKECQDSSLTLSLTDSDAEISVAVVSDGHGGEKYKRSADGSYAACAVASQVLMDFAQHSGIWAAKRIDKSVRQQIVNSILAHWCEIVGHGNNNIQEFGCTLISYLQTPNYWLALQIGDGRLAMLKPSGKWMQPIPWDDRCILNLTTSMCDEDAANEFRFAVGSRRPRAVFIGSDGIDGSFGVSAKLYNFYGHILKSIRNDGLEEVTEQLPEVLSHYSEIGSKDDMSVAAVINI